ncbi:hypothetical protein AB6D20_028120 (plasmid) [Vibrio splendidus]
MVNLESHYQTSSNGFEVEKLYVLFDNTFKGKGLGRKLLNEVENQFGNKYWLYTWVENESNGFYELICTIIAPSILDILDDTLSDFPYL